MRGGAVSDKKIIAVAGATGAQGGGLARAILADPDGGFAVRALTRDPSSDAAKALADAGAEVVAGRPRRPGEPRAGVRRGVRRVLRHVLLGRTSRPSASRPRPRPWPGRRRAAGLRHVDLVDVRGHAQLVPLDDDRMPTLQGNYKVPHFDGKGEADDFFTDAGVPTTFLLTSFYWENFIYFGMGPARGEDGVLRVTFPMGDKKLPSIAAEDIGKFAYGIFKRGDEFIGKTVGMAGEHLTGAEIAAAFAKALGEPVEYNDVSPDIVSRLRLPRGRRRSGTCSSSSATSTTITAARAILRSCGSSNPSVQTFDQWLATNVSRVRPSGG